MSGSNNPAASSDIGPQYVSHAQIQGKQLANVACSVEIYPFEGSDLAIQGGQIQSVVVSKSIRGVSTGTATVNLAPGGPKGVNDPQTWAQCITPMRNMLIGMSRGGKQQVVFDGIVPAATESQIWRTSDRGLIAARAQTIQAADFT